ncbi:MAG: hypothetical protein ACLRZ7_10490 [Lachnospiraceae bacterium]
MNLQTEAFVMGGGTYVRMLPHAFAFGIGGMPKTKTEKDCRLFAPQYGGAHQPDEGLCIEAFIKALTIYVMGIVALNEIDLK